MTAGSDIDKNLRSRQFTFDHVLLDDSFPKKFSVAVQSDDSIAPQDLALRQSFWIKNIRVSDDIPGANVLLEMKDERIELKATKLISTGHELLLWFSEEILSLMGIPFLIPANIQGNAEVSKTRERKEIASNGSSLQVEAQEKCFYQ